MEAAPLNGVCAVELLLGMSYAYLLSITQNLLPPYRQHAIAAAVTKSGCWTGTTAIWITVVTALCVYSVACKSSTVQVLYGLSAKTVTCSRIIQAAQVPYRPQVKRLPSTHLRLETSIYNLRIERTLTVWGDWMKEIEMTGPHAMYEVNEKCLLNFRW
jgi:hypothetical protein